MRLAREGGAAIGKDRDVEIAHMRVAHVEATPPLVTMPLT